jgi:hypothetical protein
MERRSFLKKGLLALVFSGVGTTNFFSAFKPGMLSMQSPKNR